MVWTYLETCLKPRLAALGVDQPARELVAVDVRQRLASLLHYWDEPSRIGPLLVTGLEEVTYYQPLDAPLAVRALVVLGVRNSLLEHLSTTVPITRELAAFRQSVPDDQVARIMQAAVEYFAAADLAAMADEARADPSADWFGGFPQKYPRAWRALVELSAPCGDDWTLEPAWGRLAELPAAGGACMPKMDGGLLPP